MYDCKGSGLFKEGLICISKENKWGVLDSSGNEVIPFIYDDMAVEFSEELLAVGKNGKYGCIDKQGSEVVPFIYDDLRNFSEGRAAARMGNVWGFINKENKAVVPFAFETVYSYSEGLALVMQKGRNAYFIDKNGEVNIALKRSYNILDYAKMGFLALAVAGLVFMLIRALI
ncbi:conserved hypothetical protein [uncultured Dysgonomonas sp.]|uniref:WG repeat-containing protein n=1 Tax=uncultured Dysgonomonas sp. TaxID=206096 RepID=A0A212JR61_9BACT|nr:conserved hypothetical protein [uncultured Dysgonomonas sp.]